MVEGAGYSVVGDQRLDWEDKDVFTVPTWTFCEHVNSGDRPAFLFSFSDAPVMQALSLYRERPGRSRGVESMRIKVEAVAFIRWYREQGDGWEKIAATGAPINEETGDRVIIESDTIFAGDRKLTLRCDATGLSIAVVIMRPFRRCRSQKKSR